MAGPFGGSRRATLVVAVALALAACGDRKPGPGPPTTAPTGTAALLALVAGTGAIGFSGDGGPAIAAQLSQPSGLAVERGGAILIADLGNNRIRRVDETGVISTVAGIGTAGFSGDGGPSTAAQLNHPAGIALAADGTIFIADRDNNRVRSVAPGGVITTVAGTGLPGFSGDGGPATAAQLNQPTAVALDRDGNLYIADSANARVRRVVAGGRIQTVAGTGSAGYSGDGGRATAAQLGLPTGVAVNARAEVFIADARSHVVRKVRPDGVIVTVAGTAVEGFSGDGGPATSAQLDRPSALAIDGDGNLLIADRTNNRIRRVDTTGVITTVAGPETAAFPAGGGVPTDLRLPAAIAVEADGDVLIADTGNNRVGRLAP